MTEHATFLRGIAMGESARWHDADGVAFPNGMAITPDGSTLIVAESFASRLSAWDIAADGSLSNRRVWATVEDGADGICIDAEGAVWCATQHGCARVRAGGE